MAKKPTGRLPKIVQAGDILLAEPFNPRPIFKRTVVLITKHNKSGTVGFVFNRPTDVMIHQAVDYFPEFNAPLHWGGSEHLDSIFILHTRPGLKNATEITNGIYYGANMDEIGAMVDDNNVFPNEIKFIAGCTFWQPGELVQEIENQYWWVAKADKSIFSEPSQAAWGNILQRLGHVYGIMNDFPEDPSVN